MGELSVDEGSILAEGPPLLGELLLPHATTTSSEFGFRCAYHSLRCRPRKQIRAYRYR